MKTLGYRVIAFIWQLFDFFWPKQKNTWAFATHHIQSTRFIENQRAVFEYVKTDPKIKKIIFYRNSKKEIDIKNAKNIELVEQGTFRAFYALLLCKVVFITHSISMDYSIRYGKRGFTVLKINPNRRVVVNLWHGIAIKGLLYAANEKARKRTDRIKFRYTERKYYAGLVASSDIDALAMAAMFYPLNYIQIWKTGLPRNDFLRVDREDLPGYIKNSLKALENLKKDKHLIVYAPTYRQIGVSSNAHYYQFSTGEISELKDFLRAHNAILGYRPHYFRNTENYFNLDQYIDNDLIFDLSQAIIPEFSAIARACDVVVTDYSSVALEILYLDKPVLSFAYDLENYRQEQDGLIYDLSLIFGKKIFTTFNELLENLRMEFTSTHQTESTAINKKIFFKYRDCHNAERLVEETIKKLDW